MRIRMTDGTHEVEVEADTDTSSEQLSPQLAVLITTVRQLYADLTPSTDRGRSPFGYGPSLDGTTLSSDTERAEPYDEPGRDDYDEDDST